MNKQSSKVESFKSLIDHTSTKAAIFDSVLVKFKRHNSESVDVDD